MTMNQLVVPKKYSTPKPERLSPIQRQYLNDRLKDATNEKRDNVDRRKMPADIRAAQRKVEKWNNQQYAQERKLRDRIALDRAKVDKVVLFGTPQEALAAVEAFEKLKVK